MVRPRSATPLSAGSNPACTSKEKRHPVWECRFFFPLDVQALDLNSVPCTFGATESGSHTPLADQGARSLGEECGYLHTLCEYPAYGIPFGVPFFLSFGCAGFGFELGSVHLRCNGVPVHICRAERVAKWRESVRKQLSVVFPRA